MGIPSVTGGVAWKSKERPARFAPLAKRLGVLASWRTYPAEWPGMPADPSGSPAGHRGAWLRETATQDSGSAMWGATGSPVCLEE